MRHVRDVIRMKAAGMPSREIARRVGAAPSTVRLTIRRFEAAGLAWSVARKDHTCVLRPNWVERWIVPAAEGHLYSLCGFRSMSPTVPS